MDKPHWSSLIIQLSSAELLRCPLKASIHLLETAEDLD
jgi:hypothetical protein